MDCGCRIVKVIESSTLFGVESPYETETVEHCEFHKNAAAQLSRLRDLVERQGKVIEAAWDEFVLENGCLVTCGAELSDEGICHCDESEFRKLLLALKEAEGEKGRAE